MEKIIINTPGNDGTGTPKVETLRELILKRFDEMKQHQGAFSKTTMRYQGVIVDGKHISDVNLNEVDDATLLLFFERVCRRYYAQM